MKPLNLKEIALKEEMKERCLAKGQYIDENAKAKFEMLCHLEDFEVQYWELQQENKQLQKDIKNIIKILDKNCDDLEATEEEFDSLDRWQGLQVVELEQGSDNNEIMDKKSR